MAPSACLQRDCDRSAWWWPSSTRPSDASSFMIGAFLRIDVVRVFGQVHHRVDHSTCAHLQAASRYAIADGQSRCSATNILCDAFCCHAEHLLLLVQSHVHLGATPDPS